MVSVTASLDLGAVHRLDTALSRIQREYPDHVAGSVRRAGLYVLKSLKARTIKAPKRMRASEYRLEPIKGDYFTKKNGAVLHHWRFTHLPGTAHEVRKTFAAYATRQRSKATKWKWRGFRRAEERREIVKYHDLLKIRRAGLAKLSWDWIAKKVVGSAASVTVWKRERGERRDPRNFVKGIMRRITGKGAEVEISNSLDYILAAVPPSAVDAALEAAAKRLEHNLLHDFPPLKEVSA